MGGLVDRGGGGWGEKRGVCKRPWAVWFAVWKGEFVFLVGGARFG